MFKGRFIALIFTIVAVDVAAQQTDRVSPEVPYSQKLANTAIHLLSDSVSVDSKAVNFDRSLVLKGIEGIWLATADPEWFNYIQKQMDDYVAEDGKSLKGLENDRCIIDQISNGRMLLTLYRVTGREKYKNAVLLLNEQLKGHPETKEYNFCVSYPFYAEYALVFGKDSIFNDLANRFVLMEKHFRDTKTRGTYNSYKESKEKACPGKVAGTVALGWYGMTMVDALDYFPTDHPGRKQIIDILTRFAAAVAKVQDSETGMWYGIVDQPNRKPNDTESSATAMLSYTLAKGARIGYLPLKFAVNSKTMFETLKKENFMDGNDGFTGAATIILAANEYEMLPTANLGKGRNVVLDNFFNNEWMKGPGGDQIPFHYVWEERSNNGYHFLGNIFQQFGANISTLKQSPTAANLKNASVYIIVDPDTEKETAKPNYMNEIYATTIANWVKAGGVLVLQGNNKGNAEMQKFNILAKKFGIIFNDDNQLMVQGKNYEQGALLPGFRNPVFKTAKKLYLKEATSLSLGQPAKSILSRDGKDYMAISKYGRGTVFVIGDPWIYNEYVDGRILPPEYENNTGARDFVKFLLKSAQPQK